MQITASQPNGYAVRLWGRFRDAVRARRAIVRSASLTARVSGNISATSGSRRTTLVPSAYRAAVMPRTAFEKSYSGRIVSSSDPGDRALPLFFFIYGVGSCITTMCDCKTGSRLPQSGRGYSSDTKQTNPTGASTPTGITGRGILVGRQRRRKHPSYARLAAPHDAGNLERPLGRSFCSPTRCPCSQLADCGMVLLVVHGVGACITTMCDCETCPHIVFPHPNETSCFLRFASAFSGSHSKL